VVVIKLGGVQFAAAYSYFSNGVVDDKALAVAVFSTALSSTFTTFGLASCFFYVETLKASNKTL
jgi:hypothetical protein